MTRKGPANLGLGSLVTPAESGYYIFSTGQLYYQSAPDPLISTDLVSKILLFVENTLNRMADLVQSDFLPRIVHEYWTLFFEDFCQKYINSMFEK